MKTTIIFTILTALLLSCSGETTTELDNTNIGSQSEISMDAPKSDKETEVEITFLSGSLKGTHLFKPDKTNPISQINVGFSDNVSNLSASALISDDGNNRLTINRPFMGEATVGSQKAKKYTNECGLFVMKPLNEGATYDRIDGAYQNCTSTNVTAVGAWEEGSVYNRRGVVANFQDKVQLETRLEDGSTTTELVEVDITIKARESRLK